MERVTGEVVLETFNICVVYEIMSGYRGGEGRRGLCP